MSVPDLKRVKKDGRSPFNEDKVAKSYMPRHFTGLMFRVVEEGN